MIVDSTVKVGFRQTNAVYVGKETQMSISKSERKIGMLNTDASPGGAEPRRRPHGTFPHHVTALSRETSFSSRVFSKRSPGERQCYLTWFCLCLLFSSPLVSFASSPPLCFISIGPFPQHGSPSTSIPDSEKCARTGS